MRMANNNNNVAHFKNKNIYSVGDKNKVKTKINIILEFSNFQNFIYFIPPLIAVLCYLNSLNGDFVHDDVYAIKNNQDVTGKKPLMDLFSNDFWGRPMTSFKSHKSYRPITVLSFRWNFWLFGPEPLYFHLVNVFLHAIVTCLFVQVCHDIFQLCRTQSILTGILFAVHPIHVEAVTGIVGRAEILAALMFLTSFICYIRSLTTSDVTEVPRVTRPWMFVCCLLSSAVAMLCKETGITVLGVCLLYDVLVLSRKHIIKALQSKSLSTSILPLARRMTIVSTFLALLLGLRMWIMGGELPIFLHQDNPASFSQSFQTRFLTFSFLWSYNGWLLLDPASLCYDWQGGSIPLVESFGDLRNLATVAAVVIATCLIYVVYKNFKNIQQKKPDPVLLSLILTIMPFLPASNLFFRVGFVLAERVLYMPSPDYQHLIENRKRNFTKARKTQDLVYTVIEKVEDHRTKT